MAAIKIKYPEFVDTDNIIENPKSSEIYRYLLFIPFITEMIRKDNSKSVVVILKNPSKASKYECDVTVSKVCNVAFSNGYSGVYILNLFPCRYTNANEVKSFIDNKDEYSKHMAVNKTYIKKALSVCDDVIFAWGSNSIKQGTNVEYKNAISDIKEICRGKKLLEARKKNKPKQRTEPLHGQRWFNNNELMDYNENNIEII